MPDGRGRASIAATRSLALPSVPCRAQHDFDKHWRMLWFFDAFWHSLYFVLLSVCALLWAPSANSKMCVPSRPLECPECPRSVLHPSANSKLCVSPCPPALGIRTRGPSPAWLASFGEGGTIG